MICLNELIDMGCNKRIIIKDFIILLSPYAPFISEEIWEHLGHSASINEADWPIFNEEYLKEKNFTYPISFNGKLKFKLKLENSLSKNQIEEKVLSHVDTMKYVNGRIIKRMIIVPNKIINIVI